MNDFNEFVRELSQGFISYKTLTQLIPLPILILLIIFIMIAVVVVYLRVNIRREEGRIETNAERIRIRGMQRGLTRYQMQILVRIAEIRNLAESAQVLNDPAFFEQAVGGFLEKARRLEDKDVPLESICKDIVITHEKLYYLAEVRKPLAAMSEIEANRLMYLTTDEGYFDIGKITDKNEAGLVIQLLGGNKTAGGFAPGTPVRCYLWRSGDGGYAFTSPVAKVTGTVVEIAMPPAFEHVEADHFPFIDVNVPCTILSPEAVPVEGEKPMQLDGLIFKLDENEAVIRTNQKLQFNIPYTLEFKMEDFKIKAASRIMRDIYFKDRTVYYYNVRFTEISSAARAIIRNYIIDRRTAPGAPQPA
ncbi:MAG: hypothetical protein EPN93_06445 [Spirochaetes bacterium]|nr:MAG: hypothetical protein EPN93_06445 [Spirochaetota bacterium]